MKLESFKDKQVTRRKKVLLCLGVITIVGVSLLLYKTFASFRSEVDLDNDNVLFGFYNGETKLDEMPQKGNSNNLVFEKAVCDNGASVEWDEEKWSPLVKGLNKAKTKCTLYFSEKKTTGVDILEEKEKEEKLKEEPELMYDDTDDRNLRYVGASPNNYIDIGNRYRSDIYSISYSEYAKPFGEYSSYEECTESIDYLEYSDYGATCEKTHSKGDPILWRIVGVMNNMTNVEKNTKESLIKIVRENDIGLYIFDINQYHNENIYIGINDYSQSGLMKLLNDGYNNNTIYNFNAESEELINNSLYWNSESGKCVYRLGNGGEEYDGYITKNCNFTTNGLENEVRSKLAKVRWNTGALDASQYPEDDNDSYTKNIYKLERMDNVPCGGLDVHCDFGYSGGYLEDGLGRNTFWDGYIGLLYNSDFKYAIGGKERNWCLIDSFEGDGNDCPNWFNNYAYAHNATYTINPIYSPNSMNLFGKCDYSASNQDYTVYPVAYLKSSVSITDAAGTPEDPFVAS